MQRYLEQLIADIVIFTNYASLRYAGETFDMHDWISDKEEDRIARTCNLQELTGIYQDMLPPAEMLNDEQLISLLDALKKMLDAYNCSVVLQIEVPELIVYETIRNNFNQEVKLKRWHMGFFEFCKP